MRGIRVLRGCGRRSVAGLGSPAGYLVPPPPVQPNPRAPAASPRQGPDFFNAKQFPLIAFKSSAVKPVEGGLQVTGDLTLHGVSRPVTFVLRGGKTAEFPKGVQRVGYSVELTIKRSDFGMDKFTDA